ncbi:hypothetical protein LIER_03261 [Lithospermum erythrorhizon]|uniref:Uncharacterized protein n=1 Tax=Lithospermum erythrorhizon TaxID=34254 RepID=A0AAV3NX70_LITER
MWQERLGMPSKDMRVRNSESINLDPGEDWTTKVVYGLWIKAPLDRRRFQETREEGSIFSEEVAGLQALSQIFVDPVEADPIVEEVSTRRQSPLTTGSPDTRNEALALFNFKSTVA